MAEETVDSGLSGDLDILDAASEETTPEVTEEEGVTKEIVDKVITEEAEKLIAEGEEKEEEEEGDEEKEIELSDDEEILEEAPEEEDEGPLAERPLKGMKAKYPKVFKDFPALKQAWYSSREFYNVFPTVQAAKEAAERSTLLAEVEKDIFRDGSSKELLTRIKDGGDKESYGSFLDGFLENVKESDEQKYFEMITPVFDQLINHLQSEGQRLNSDNVKGAAKIVYDMIHPNGSTPQKQTDSKEQLKLDRDKKSFEAERQEHFEGQYGAAQNKVLNRVETAVKANVARSLSKLEVSGYLKDNIVSDVLGEVWKNLKQDGEFQNSQGSLWNTAAKNGFSEDSLAQIADGALRRVSKVLPKIRGEVRSKALGGNVKASEKSTKKRSSGSSGGRRKKVATAKDIREMSDLDVLSDDVVV